VGGTAFTAIAVVPLLQSLVFATSVAMTIARVRSLPGVESASGLMPKLSLVVPACNEADTIEAALRTKLAASYPDLEVVVVVDRSTDDTLAIVERLAREDPRLRVERIDTLPAGWLGKVHALHRGVVVSSGELLLFSDADVRFSHDVVLRAVADLERQGLDVITLVPRLTSQSFWLDATMTTFLRFLVGAGRIWLMRDPRTRVAVGGGIFNLVRRSAYDRSPGFEWIKMEVADDVALVQMLKRSGARCDVFNGAGDVELAYYSTLREFVLGLEKNCYAASSFQFRVALVVLMLIVYIEFVPYVLLAAATGPARLMALATIALVVGSQVALARWVKRPLLSAALPFFGSAIFFWTSVRGIFLAHKRGGIFWRGTFYSLDELRRGARFERF
jgi:cellulose synthase/poly-beta-1,6-N-acetylglucosamine synthase-like glycosyltransferase